MKYLHKFETFGERNNFTDTSLDSYVSFTEEINYLEYTNDVKSFNENINKYLTFEIKTNGTIEWHKEGSSPSLEIFYRKNNGAWTSTTTNNIITAYAGDIIEFKGDNDTYSSDELNYHYFAGTANFVVSGNIMSLVHSENFNIVSNGGGFRYLFYNSNIISATKLRLPSESLTSYYYKGLFKNCSKLKESPRILPAINLNEAEEVYMDMFNGCSSLEEMPIIDAENIGISGFRNMFKNCTNLKKIYDLKLLSIGEYSCANMFEGCTSLLNTPRLSVSIFRSNCCQNMFLNCSSIVTQSTLSNYSYSTENCCFKGMFQNCTSLAITPELPTMVLSDHCYESMFEGCTSLTVIPELPATNLKESCYKNMFKDCTSIVTVSALSATTLAANCYDGMFNGCSVLNFAPEVLPATTLEIECYARMFANCSLLKKAPILPATTLIDGCYKQMFTNCSSLEYIQCDAIGDVTSSCTEMWTAGVSDNGFFMLNSNIEDWPEGDNGIPYEWTVTDRYTYFRGLPLTMEAIVDGVEISFAKSTSIRNSKSVDVSTDGINWIEVTSDIRSEAPVIRLNAGDKLMIRGNNDAMNDVNMYDQISDTDRNFHIVASKPTYVYGNIMSLLSKINFAALDTFTAPAALSYVFSGYNWPEADRNHIEMLQYRPLVLPATNLTSCCYKGMFQNSSISVAPELPATTLAPECYADMFNDSDLKFSPKLPAIELQPYCYASMFYSSKLTAAPELPATTLAEGCYRGMFMNCSSLTAAPELPATTLKEYCYTSMFNGCTSLIIAPELPATTVAQHCYELMFKDCINLVQLPKLSVIDLAEYCYNEMFDGCQSFDTVIILAETNLGYLVNMNIFGDNPPTNVLLLKSENAEYSDIRYIVESQWTVANYKENWTFAGLKIAKGPLYFNGESYEIKDNWDYNSYNSIYGNNEGSTYFNFIEIGKQFDLRKQKFTERSGSINNICTLDGWRLPTKEESDMILGYRQGTDNKYYEDLIAIVNDSQELLYYITLFYPDGQHVFNNSSILYPDFIEINNDTYKCLTLNQLNKLLKIGCIYIPHIGYCGNESWYDDYYNINCISATSVSRDIFNPAYSSFNTASKSEYYPVCLVKSISNI